MIDGYYTVFQLVKLTTRQEIQIRWDIITNKLKAVRKPYKKYGYFAVSPADAKAYIAKYQ